MTYAEKCAIQDICLNISSLTDQLNRTALRAERGAKSEDVCFMGPIWLEATAIAIKNCENETKMIIAQLLDFMDDSEKDCFLGTLRALTKAYASLPSLQ